MADDASTTGNQRIDPGIANSARQAATPDGDLYTRHATPRISSANLALSIAAVIVLLVLVVVLVMWL